MKIPRYTAQTQRVTPISSGAVRASDIGALTQTGGMIEARAIGGVGQAFGSLADVAMRATRLEGEAQYADFKDFTTDQMNQFGHFISNNPNADIDKEYQKTLSKIRTNMPKDPWAAGEGNEYFNSQKVIWDESIWQSKETRSENHFKAALVKSRVQAIQSDEANVDLNFGEYVLLSWQGVKNGVISEQQAVTDIANASTQHEQYVKIQEKVFKAKREEDLLVQEEADRDVISDAIRAKSPETVDIIQSSQLIEEEKWKWEQRFYDALNSNRITSPPDYDEKTRLTQMAQGIPSGVAEMREFKKQVAAAYRDGMFGNDPEKSSGIRDDLLALGAAEQKPLFRNAMSKRMGLARELLVQFPSDLDWKERIAELYSVTDKGDRKYPDDFVVREVGRRRLQVANADAYNQALRNHFEIPKNADPSVDEIEKVSKAILVDYRLTNEQLRARSEEEQRAEHEKREALKKPLSSKELSNMLPLTAPLTSAVEGLAAKVTDMAMGKTRPPGFAKGYPFNPDAVPPGGTQIKAPPIPKDLKEKKAWSRIKWTELPTRMQWAVWKQRERDVSWVTIISWPELQPYLKGVNVGGGTTGDF